ncbi:kinesin-like protein KIF11 isoform X2 [Photinus pyralis]|nr:kinesin-like protein KIF11 isoform X2 [Photinus pyralis]
MSTPKSEDGNPQPIRVFLRVRPLQDNEKRTNCLEVLNTKEIQANRTYQKKYTFDGLFREDTAQPTIYKIVIKPLIQDVLSGYNCTIFGYGQSGTGKTYTLLGNIVGLTSFGSTNSLSNVSLQSDSDNCVVSSSLDLEAGLIPRAVVELFEVVRLLSDPCTVRCSYLEIYNEELHDLLSPVDDSTNLRIYDGQRGKGDVVIQGLESVTVYSEVDVFQLLKKAQRKQMRVDRACSHTIFSIIVDRRETSPVGEMLSKIGRLNFVDLAGSDNIRTGAVERRAKDANIYQSLVTLGQVIKVLSEKNSFVPFRDSKLTRILRDSLGGKAKTIFIATISFSVSSLDESLNTLDYVSKARTITNKPIINRRTSQKSLMNEYADEISSLRRDLDAAQGRGGVVINPENYDQLVATRQATDEQLSQAVASINAFGEKLRLLEEEKENFRVEQDALIKSYGATQSELAKMKVEYARIASEKQENEYLASSYERSAENLYKSAKSLHERVKSGSLNESTLREKIEYLYKVTNDNNNTRKMVSVKVRAMCQDIVREYGEYAKGSMSFNEKLANVTRSYHNQQSELVNDLLRQILTVQDNVQNADNVPYQQAGASLKNCQQAQGRRLTDLKRKLDDWQISNLSNFKTIMENTLRPHLENKVANVESLGLRVSKAFSQLPFDSTSADIKILCAEIFENIDQLGGSLSRQREAGEKKLASLAKIRDEMFAAVNAKFDALKGELRKESDGDLRALQLIENLRKTVDGKLPNVVAEFEKGCDRVLDTTSNEVTEFIDKTTHDSSQVLDSYKSSTDALWGSEKEKLSQIADEATDQDFVAATVSDLHKVRNSLSENVATLAKETTEFCPGNSERENREVCTLIDDNYQGSLALLNRLTSEANEIKILVSDTSKYAVELQPSGHTPLRNQSELSYQLKELTPKEMVLRRFHQLKQENGDASNQQPKKLFHE